MKDELSEKEAVFLLKKGNIRGLEVLVRDHQLQAVRAADLITRNYALAEDIVQTAFIRAYERFDQFDESKPFGPWFLRIVVNDALKAVTRRKGWISFDSNNNPDNTDHIEFVISDFESGLDEKEEAQDLHRKVWQALGAFQFWGIKIATKGHARNRGGQ
jgi:RNA polymerase sigma-70 factor, ECF subfamily